VANVALAIGLLAVTSCTLSLDISATQCRHDQDCARFAGAVCDTGTQVCKPGPGPDAASGGGGGGADGRWDAGSAEGSGEGDMSAVPADRACRAGDDCVACGPAPLEDSLQNRCTDVTCVPFDNRTRLTNLGVDGTLMPLPGS
jgi:hypothetical protein